MKEHKSSNISSVFIYEICSDANGNGESQSSPGRFLVYLARRQTDLFFEFALKKNSGNSSIKNPLKNKPLIHKKNQIFHEIFIRIKNIF